MSDLMKEEYQLEIENRIKNLIWTVCGDYTLEARPDVEGFLKSRYIALYDGIKQGAFAKYYDKEELSLYLVKKLFVHAHEDALVNIAQLCIEEAVEDKIIKERSGVRDIQKHAFQDTLDMDFSSLVKSEIGQLKIALFREKIQGEYVVSNVIREKMEQLYQVKNAVTTRQVIEKIDELYNLWMEPGYEAKYGTLDQILSVTLEEIASYKWKDFLSEEMYEDNLEAYLERIAQEMTSTRSPADEAKDLEKADGVRQRKITLVDEETLQKAYSYVELNFGRTYLTPLEEKRRNFQNCKGIHGDCSLYYTDGILRNPVMKNYQYEYARKQKSKNKYAYYDHHRVVKRNIQLLTEVLKKAIVLRDETSESVCDRGVLIPSRLWKVGRTKDAKLFKKEEKNSRQDFVVDVLIDASGSQRQRQEKVVLQAYIIMEALSSVGIPHRVTGFCTFWDYTILQRYREYDDDPSENERIFEFTTSSNNRDGLAIKAISQELINREEEKKILIILSDGRPYDVILNRPNARNPKPYQGDYAIKDTGFEVRKLRNEGICVLGVFAGEEKDLEAEKKIFGKDFAYIRDIGNFSKIVGRYLKKQLEENN
ncbi:MAG: cobaltochelatase CobT-related protein [Ruminococcus sp.]|jgi:hypothetical protein